MANAVAVESKRSTKKQLNFPFTRIQVRSHCLNELQLCDPAAVRITRPACQCDAAFMSSSSFQPAQALGQSCNHPCMMRSISK